MEAVSSAVTRRISVVPGNLAFGDKGVQGAGGGRDFAKTPAHEVDEVRAEVVEHAAALLFLGEPVEAGVGGIGAQGRRPDVTQQLKLAEQAGLDERVEALASGPVAELKVGGVDDAGLFGEGDHLPGFSGIVGEGLLGDDVDATSGAVTDELKV